MLQKESLINSFMVTLFTEVHLGLDIDGLPQGQRISQRSGLWTQFSGLVNFASMSWDRAGTAPPAIGPGTLLPFLAMGAQPWTR